MENRVILYTRPSCHLCEEAKAHLLRLKNRYNLVIQEVDISGKPDLEEKYGNIIPVLDFQGGRLLYGRVNVAQILRALGGKP